MEGELPTAKLHKFVTEVTSNAKTCPAKSHIDSKKHPTQQQQHVVKKHPTQQQHMVKHQLVPAGVVRAQDLSAAIHQLQHALNVANKGSTQKSCLGSILI